MWGGGIAAMSEGLTKSQARNIFFGGSLFFFVVFAALTGHSHYYAVPATRLFLCPVCAELPVRTAALQHHAHAAHQRADRLAAARLLRRGLLHHPEESEREIHSPKIAYLQLILLLVGTLGAVVTYMFNLFRQHAARHAGPRVPRTAASR
jgi:hypothetical protein